MMTRTSGPRLDEEYSQALARVTLSAAATAICFGAWLLSASSSAAGLLGSTIVGGYWLFSLVWAVLVRRRPGRSVLRRAVAIVGDIGITSAGIYLMGEIGAMFYPLYLWVIVGNGMRYGSRYLYAALGIGAAGFSIVLLTGEYWQRHAPLGVGLMFGLALLPLFYVTVIRRLHASNARLAAALEASEAATSAQAQLARDNARLLREAQDAAAALSDKNAELDTFVYTVSHDLKAPLVTIQGMAGMLASQHAASLDDEGRRYVDRIELNARRMEGLLLDLLALARIGREAHVPEAIELASVVEDVVAELAPTVRAHGITVSVGALPVVWGVRVQMEQLFRNLLTNAVKYMGTQPAPAIEIGARPHGDLVECWVRDNGIGIEPAYHDKVFELFQRLKEVPAEGTGVGLPIVKRIVEAAGGRIWIESARGAGTTFRFTWPSAPLAGGAAASALAAAERHA